MKYTIVPLEQFNADPKIAELCKMLGEGNVSQNIAQAAAWNMANGLSWKSTCKAQSRESQYTGNEKFFTQSELQAAARLTGLCRDATEQRLTYTSVLVAIQARSNGQVACRCTRVACAVEQWSVWHTLK